MAKKTEAQLVLIMREHGIVHPKWTLVAATKVGLDLSSACAMLLMETSGGINEFGHDPTSSIPKRWMGTTVTKAKYLYYRWRRNHGGGNQGVGPCQLTSSGLQDDADHRGGCHVPLHNMETGFKFLNDLQKQHGTQLAFQNYNGSGPRAVAYGKAAEALRKHFHDLFT